MRNPTYADAVQALGRTSDGICSHGKLVALLWDVPEDVLNEDVDIYRRTHDDAGNLLPGVTYAGAGLLAGLNYEERDLVAKSLVINAIKAVRNRTGLGLKESKDLVENFILLYPDSNPKHAEYLRSWRTR